MSRGARGDRRGARRTRAAQPADRRRPVPLLRPRPADAQRRRLRRATCSGSRSSRTEFPDLRTPAVADAAGRRHLLDAVHRGRPSRADAQPGQHLLRARNSTPGRTGSSARRAPCPATCASSRSTAWRSTSCTRTAGSCAAPPAATGAPARTSRRTSARIDNVPDRLDGRRRPDAARGPRRGVLPGRRLRGAQRVARRGGQGAVREPAQHRGRVAAAEGPAGHREPSPGDGRARRRTGRERPEGHRRSPGGTSGCRRWGLPTSERFKVEPDLDGVQRFIDYYGEHRHDRRARDRRRRRQGRRARRCSASSGRPAARRAGRSRSSTRRRRSTPSCSTSG